MTTAHVLDGSTVTLHGVASSVTCNGPLTVSCEGLTVGGSFYQGEILVTGGTATQLLRHSAHETASTPFVFAFAIMLGFIASRFRL